MSKRKIITVALLGLFICSLLILVPVQPVQQEIQKGTSTFVISSWSYPDEYGQGISGIFITENSTGDWLTFGTIDYDDVTEIEWNASLFIRLTCFAHFNNTLVGAVDVADGKNYHRHNVTVTSSGVTVFSQQNFTYISGIDYSDPIWDYSYFVILNFLPEQGQIYVVTVTYEVFY